MLLPCPKIESNRDFEKSVDDLVLHIKEQKLRPQEERRYLFTIALLRTFAGCALDVVSQPATSEIAREATATAFIRSTARKVASMLGFEMKRLS